jgi:hypothetical protein
MEYSRIVAGFRLCDAIIKDNKAQQQIKNLNSTYRDKVSMKFVTKFKPHERKGL